MSKRSVFMNKKLLLTFMGLAFAAACLFGGTGTSYARSSLTPQQRKAAAARAAAARAQQGPVAAPSGGAAVLAAPLLLAPALTPGTTPDYFGTIPNYANSELPALNLSTGAITGGIRKFINTLPGLGYANRNNINQYIPVATPDTSTYSGSDYYELKEGEYTEQFHTDLPATTKLRGYAQTNSADVTVNNVFQYLGPAIIAQRDRPVRIKVTNNLPTGSAGNLFLPVDTTYMGAGTGPLGGTELYTQNRTSLHLHGGVTPWISDGTPHQWFTPAGEVTSYKKGVSFQNVPDMADPGNGSESLYYTNQQSARLMFYHDHALGITRLNVYGGMAAPYIVYDTQEEAMITSGAIPGLGETVYRYGIPLVIQDKTFVPNTTQLASEDPTWDTSKWGGTGNLWFPHVYMTNQNPSDPAGANAMGRWDYGPWFWPPLTAAAGLVNGPVANPLFGTTAMEGPVNPGTPNPTGVPEAFMDTPVVNGTAYPTLPVLRKAYRFRILNVCNDRAVNLQLYYADPVGATVISGGSGYSSAPAVAFSGGGAVTQATGTATITNVVNAIAVTAGGSGYTSAPVVTITGSGTGASAITTVTGGVVTSVIVVSGGAGYTTTPTVSFTGGGGSGATAIASITGVVSGITITSAGSGYTSAPTVTLTGGGGTGALVLASPNTEVKLVPAVPTASFPPTWPTDGRDGGVPDPAVAGPAMIQIGTEGGFLPAPAVLPNTPVGYDYNRRSITVLNVLNHTLLLGPAERADVIIDFSQAPAGSKLILYNDAPTPIPASDPRLDYYSGDPDNTSTGGAPTTLPGYGPNTRTVMRFDVDTGAASAAFNMGTLQTALSAAYTASQPAPIVPETTYPAPYNAAVDTYSGISDNQLTFTPVGSSTPTTVSFTPKAIVEDFEFTYGRMNATLGVELARTNLVTQTSIPFKYIDPPTEVINDGETQIWKITHNGVDTHSIHVHLFNMQLINRVGWDGALKPPDANELGWKETVRMNPLEDIIVALKPIVPTVPFALPRSLRPLDPTMPLGTTMQFTGVDTSGNPITVTNTVTDFGYEYVWHCHLLGHEENDMMRPIVINSVPVSVSLTSSAAVGVSGTAMTFTATGAGGSHSYLYSFWLSGPANGWGWTNVQAYSTTATYTWTPGGSNIGANTIAVWIKNATSAATFDATSKLAVRVYATTPPASSVSLTALPTSGVAGTSATFTAAGSGGTGNYQYSFWLSGPANGWGWTNVQAYSTAATFTWTPTAANVGANTIAVYVRNVGSVATFEAVRTLAFNVNPSTAATSVSLSHLPTSGTPGTPVVFTANAAGGSGSYQYSFWLSGPLNNWSWTNVQPYTTTNTYSFTPLTNSVGPNRVAVYARNAGSTATFEAVNTNSFTVNSVAPASAVSLTNPGPGTVGTPMTFTALASGGSGNYQYAFWISGPSTKWAWVAVQAYSPTATYSWTPVAGDVGSNTIAVWAKDAGSTASFEATHAVTLTVN